ncbi:hypothetical protein [Slackia sp.]|uniref:hypothetical protein n=1 Tax=Slackia sp. TaxID=2049041 RepID=UPI00399B01ED
MNSYRQASKNTVRRELLTHAVSALTERRNASACVRRSYVRDLKSHFLSRGFTDSAREAGLIDDSYICAWENLHDSCVGVKRPSDLRVCYLSGPEPMNDFEVLTGLGVLPQNIWAFESGSSEFKSGLEQCCGSDINQPKLVKMSIENFFDIVPMIFDIVYLDFCSSFVSRRHSLRCICSLFYHHRLSSPGVLVTNFSEIDESRRESFSQLMSRFNLFKQNVGKRIDFNDVDSCRRHASRALAQAQNNFEECYGNFIPSIIGNIASVSVPSQRFADSVAMGFLGVHTDEMMFDLDRLNCLEAEPLLRFFSCLDPSCAGNPFFFEGKIANTLLSELNPPGLSKRPFESLWMISLLKAERITASKEVEEAAKKFAESYRFLDRPDRVLYIDYCIRQLSYPSHYNFRASKSYSYISKTKRMFADAIVLDDCRYVYDFLPAALQGENALSNRSWVNVLRFAIDGLVKCRLAVDSDFFYRGSVVSKEIEEFAPGTLPVRKEIA